METLPPELYTWKEIPFLTQDQTTEFDYFVDFHALIKSIQDSQTIVFALQGECQVYQYDNANAIIWMTDSKFFLVTSNVSITFMLIFIIIVEKLFLFVIFMFYHRILYSRTSTRLLLHLYKVLEHGHIYLKHSITTILHLDLL
jgi:hypothetical protein